MTECSKCRSAIRGESGIRCNGVCDKVYHLTKKCAGIDQYSAKVFDETNYIRFICDDCTQYIQNVDLVLREIQDNVNKNKQTLAEYKHEFECSLKQNEVEIKNLLEAIENRYDERFKKMDNIQKICEKSVEEVKSLYVNVSEVENKNKDIFEKINNNNVKMCDEIKRVVKEANVKKLTYAQTAAKTVLPDVSKRVPLILKPKEKQTVQKTKEELNNKVDPKDFKIVNIENRRNGTLVIQSESMDEREKIKTAIQNEISDKYEVKIPKEAEMNIIITDMNIKLNEKELLEKLKKQNEVIKDSNVEIVKCFETKRFNRSIYNAKVKIDYATYHKIMPMQRLNVGWEKCRIFDGTHIMQCFNCQGFNHKASECRNEAVCFKCHGNHKSKDCTKEILNKCINCVRENKRLNLNLDESHATINRECPVYRNKLSLKKRRLGIDIEI